MKLDLISTTAALCLTAGMAQAQTTVVVSQQAGATITKGGSWQVLIPESLSRHGCRIQNLSVHTMYVYAGSGTASADNSFALAAPTATVAGGVYMCESPSAVIRSNIQVSASGDGDKLAYDVY